MKETKITSKLVMSCIIVCLFTMFMFEMAYCHLMYKDYSELYDEYIKLENKVDKLTKLTINTQSYILRQNQDI